MDKKLKTRPSISSFTGHFTKRSSAVDSVKGLPPAGKSAGPSASSSSRPTSNQEIADARKAYRASRARILADYYEQRGLTPVPVENLFEPLLSANGDIQSDFGVLSHVADDQQLKEFERILLDVYGVDTLVSQVDNIIPAHAEEKPKLKPWGRFAHRTGLLRQSLAALRSDSSRTAQQARQTIPQAPLNITDSEDMLVILNARATALLNISFRNLSQSKHIVELASLAIYLFSARKTGSDMIEDGVSDEEKIWMLKRMIQLVRDDIYTLLLSVDQDLTYADRAEQKRHIANLMRTVRTWRLIVKKQVHSMRRHAHKFESQDDYSGRMATLRDKCEQ